MDNIKTLQSLLTTHRSSKLYACEEHLELLMDIIIDECETFPDIIKDDSHSCSICGLEARYEVSAHED